MTIQFSFLLNVLLLSRLVFTFHDQAVEKKQVRFMTAVQWVGLLAYQLNWLTLACALLLAGGNIALYRLERRTKRFNEPRLLLLLVEAVFLSCLFSPWLNLGFNPLLANAANLQRYILFLSLPVDWPKLSIYLMGVLLIANEANLLIRAIFQVFDLLPRKPGDRETQLIISVDKREYNAGRVIGILERIMVYFLILNNQFSAIGLVLAAKSFTRFKELENREFAEYVLIGTLLSTLIAMLIGKLV
jgi:hypothetical protein